MKGTQLFVMGALGATLLSLAGCQRAGTSVATVNGEPITEQEFFRYLELKPEVRVRTQNGVASLPVENTLGFQALQDLIAQRLTMQLAKDKGIYPTNQEIADELAFQKELKPNFLPSLTARGLSMQMVRESLALDLIQEKLITQDIKVTAADVNKYIEENKRQFIEPEKVDLSWILVRNVQVQREVDAAMRRGSTFTQAALQYSQAPNASQRQGKLIDEATGGSPAVSSLPEAVRNAIRGKAEGTTTDWVRFVDGYAKFQVNKRIPERPVTMDDARKEFLRRLIAKNRGAQSRDIDKEVLRKLKDSQVVVTKSQYQDPWKRAFEQFKLQNRVEGLTGASE